MFDGKMKAATFSYDDGLTQDLRVIDILDKYGLKGTFNISSGCFGKDHYLTINDTEVKHFYVNPSELSQIYKNHEIASHALTHENLFYLTDEEIIQQVEEDRINLEDMTGREIVGFAYPGGGFDGRTAEVLKHRTGVKYARTALPTLGFSRPANPYIWYPTENYRFLMNNCMYLVDEFLNANPNEPMVLYIWGHGYEHDAYNDWEQFEEFCKHISGRDDIFYGTNREILGI